MRDCRSVLVVGLVSAVIVATGAVTVRKSDTYGAQFPTEYGTEVDLGSGAFLDAEERTTEFLDNEPELSERIINGELVKKRDHKYVVALLEKMHSGRYRFQCSGVLVDNYLVVTAAHCVMNRGSKYTVCGGVTDLSDLEQKQSPKKYCSRVKKIATIHKYVFVGAGYDIAMLLTKSDMEKTGAKSGRISLKKYPKRRNNGVKGYGLGFGAKSVMGWANDLKLRRTDVAISNGLSCLPASLSDDTHYFKGTSYLCAHGNYDGSKGSTCYGDSGGPLISRRKGKPDDIVGVLSLGFEKENAPGSCSPVLPSLYTRFSNRRNANFLKKAAGRFGRRLKFSS